MVQYHKSSGSPFRTLHIHIEHINSFYSVCLLARTDSLEGVLTNMYPISVISVICLWTVGQWGALQRIARRRVVADWWTFRPPPFAHQPVSLSQYSLRTHTHTHIHADCHCSAVVSSSVCTCALQTEAVRVTPMNPVDCPWGTTETGQFKQLAMSLYCIAWIYGLFLSPFLR